MDKEMNQEEHRKMVADRLMEMPELETMEQADEEIRQFHERQKQMDKIDEDDPLQDELIHKRMNDINTFQAHENEVYLRGTDEWGKDFQVCFDAYDFLNWIDTEQLKYIKEQVIKHIQDK